MTRPIFFLTDFGLNDTYVGVVKAVMLSIAPAAPIVDLTHAIPPQDVQAGAFALLTAVPYLPNDAIVLAVVDPGVGTARRPIAVQADGRVFVGPDNGLLSWALAGSRSGVSPLPPQRGRGRGRGPITGDVSGVVLDRAGYWLPQVSASFHGRDLFGPVAAHLATGASLAEVGSPISSIVVLPFPRPEHAGDTLRGEVVYVDRFGNLITNLIAADLPSDPIVTIHSHTIDGLAANFQSAAPLIAMIGSAGFLEIAVPNGSAAMVLRVSVGEFVLISPSRPSATIRA